MAGMLAVSTSQAAGAEGVHQQWGSWSDSGGVHPPTTVLVIDGVGFRCGCSELIHSQRRRRSDGIHDHTDNLMFEVDVLRLDVGVGDALVVYPR